MKRQSIFVAFVMLGRSQRRYRPAHASATRSAGAGPHPSASPVPPVPGRGADRPDGYTHAIEDAVRASRVAIDQLDMNAIRQRRWAAQQAREMAQHNARWRGMAQHDTQMHEFSLPSMNFNF